MNLEIALVIMAAVLCAVCTALVAALILSQRKIQSDRTWGNFVAQNCLNYYWRGRQDAALKNEIESLDLTPHFQAEGPGKDDDAEPKENPDVIEIGRN